MLGGETTATGASCDPGPKKDLVFLPHAEAVMDLISSEDKEFVVLDTGQVELITGRGARKNLWPRVRNWLEPRSREARTPIVSCFRERRSAG